MGIADFFGTRAVEFEMKCREATAAALRQLKINAVDMGCNVVVGLDMELRTVRDVPMVVATGTGVELEDEWKSQE